MTALVIGVGSELRGDDRVGREVAARVEQLAIDGVVVRSVQQLTPELAVEIAVCDPVVFVDASVTATAAVVERVDVGLEVTQAGTPATTHVTNPSGLLWLATLYTDRLPDAFVVSVPVAGLGLGEELTPLATAGVEEAVRLVVAVVAPDQSRA